MDCNEFTWIEWWSKYLKKNDWNTKRCSTRFMFAINWMWKTCIKANAWILWNSKKKRAKIEWKTNRHSGCAVDSQLHLKHSSMLKFGLFSIVLSSRIFLSASIQILVSVKNSIRYAICLCFVEKLKISDLKRFFSTFCWFVFWEDFQLNEWVSNEFLNFQSYEECVN